jgi:hypothetical protein
MGALHHLNIILHEQWRKRQAGQGLPMIRDQWILEKQHFGRTRNNPVEAQGLKKERYWKDSGQRNLSNYWITRKRLEFWR